MPARDREQQGPQEADPPRHTEPRGAPPRARVPHTLRWGTQPESKPEAEEDGDELTQGNGTQRAVGPGRMAEACTPCLHLAGREELRLQSSQALGPKGLVADGRTVRGRQEGGCSPAFKYIPAPGKSCFFFR